MTIHSADFSEIDGHLFMEYSKVLDKASMKYNHYHDAYEIYYLLSGERYYFIKDRTYHITKGNIVIIDRDELHKTTPGISYHHERILVNFKKAFIAEFLVNMNDIDLLLPFRQGIHMISLSVKEQQIVENLLGKMLDEYNKQPLGFNSYIKIQLLELLFLINRCKNTQFNNKPEYINSTHQKISEIVQYINTHYQEKIRLDDLSELFFISPYHLSRTFRKITGFTFSEYLNNIRIKQAQKYLKETDLNITEISQKVGFDSVTHFGRVFKKLSYVPPSEYRKSFNSKSKGVL